MDAHGLGSNSLRSGARSSTSRPLTILTTLIIRRRWGSRFESTEERFRCRLLALIFLGWLGRCHTSKPKRAGQLGERSLVVLLRRCRGSRSRAGFRGSGRATGLSGLGFSGVTLEAFEFSKAGMVRRVVHYLGDQGVRRGINYGSGSGRKGDCRRRWVKAGHGVDCRCFRGRIFLGFLWETSLGIELLLSRKRSMQEGSF